MLNRYGNRPLSFTDACTLAAMNALGIKRLASYDERSYLDLVPELLGKNYSGTLPEEELKEILRMAKRCYR